MTDPTTLAEKLKKIGLKWATEARPRLETLGEALDSIAANEGVPDWEQVGAALRLAHGLAGGAGTVGFPELSEALLPLEERLAEAIERRRIGSRDRDYFAKMALGMPSLIGGLSSKAAARARQSPEGI